MTERTGFRGAYVRWCGSCGKWTRVDEGTVRCPQCGDHYYRNKCVRCGHEWTPKGESKRCPECNSPYWNRERVR